MKVLNPIKKSCGLGDSELQAIIEQYESCVDSLPYMGGDSSAESDIAVLRDYRLSAEDLDAILKSIQSRLLSYGYEASVRDYRLFSDADYGKYPNISGGYRSRVYSERNDYRDSDKRDYTLKVLIKRFGSYDYVSVDTQMSRIGALLQDILIMEYWDIRYINFLRRKLKSNLSKVCGSMYLKQYFSGYVVQDILCNPIGEWFDVEAMDRVVALLNKHLGVINKAMESCEVVRFYTDRSLGGTANLLQGSDFSLYIGTIDRDSFPNLVEKYNEWYGGDNMTVLVGDTRASIHLLIKDMAVKKEWVNVYITQYRDKWLVGMYLRNSINPYMLLKTLYNKVKVNNIYHHSEFMVYGVYKDTAVKSVRCVCGNILPYNVITCSRDKMCPICYMKKIFKTLLNK